MLREKRTVTMFLLGIVVGVIFMAIVPTPALDAKVQDAWRWVAKKIP